MAEANDSSMRMLPLLALKNSALFPGLMMPLSVGRKGSVAAVEAALATEEKEMVVVAQRDASVDAPHADDLYTVGTRAAIRRYHHARPDQLDIMVLGMERVVIVKVEENGHMHARIRPLPLPDDSSRETEALTLSLVEMGVKFVKLVARRRRGSRIWRRCSAPHRTRCNWRSCIASIMNLDAAKEQALLETPTRLEGLRMVHGWLSHEVDVLELRNKIAEEARGRRCPRSSANTCCASRSAPSRQELGEKNADQAEVEKLREKPDRRRICRRTSARRPNANWAGWKRCRRLSRSTT